MMCSSLRSSLCSSLNPLDSWRCASVPVIYEFYAHIRERADRQGLYTSTLCIRATHIYWHTLEHWNTAMIMQYLCVFQSNLGLEHRQKTGTRARESKIFFSLCLYPWCSCILLAIIHLTKFDFSRILLTRKTFACHDVFDPIAPSERAKRFRGNHKTSPVRSSVPMAGGASKLLHSMPPFRREVPEGIKIPDRVKVLQPDNSHSRFVSEYEARELIRTGAAIGLGNKRKIYALRLIRIGQTHNERFIADAKISEKLANVPVIRPQELLAPSPRRHFSFESAVYRRLRGSSQHDVSGIRMPDSKRAHSLVNLLRVEAEIGSG